MQMWSGRTSCASADSNRLAFVDIVAFLDQKFRQMQIERQQTLAMIDDHTIPLKEKWPRQNDATAIDGCDRGPTEHAKIEPLMRALHRPVENSLHSE